MQTVLPLVQERLAESAAELACAHHLYASICTTLHGAGLARCPISLSELAVLKRDSAYMVQLCVRAVQRLVGQLGASATLDANPVQRQWRDLQVMATHIDVNRDRAMAAYASEILGCANLRMQVAAARC